jgi:hypothetical protein
MSGRAVLDRRMRWCMGVVYAGGALCLAGVLGYTLTGRGEWFGLWFPGFPAAFLGMAYAQLLGVRCPWCRGNLAPLALQRGGLSFDRRVRCCPYCARGLDEEFEPAVAGMAPDAEPIYGPSCQERAR